MATKTTASYVCVLCNRAFKIAYWYYKHMQNHSSEPTLYDCVGCDKRFPTKKLWHQHIWLEHSQKGRKKIANTQSANCSQQLIEISTQISASNASESSHLDELSTTPSSDGSSPKSSHLGELSSLVSGNSSSTSSQLVESSSLSSASLFSGQIHYKKFGQNKKRPNSSPPRPIKKRISNSSKRKLSTFHICTFCKKSFNCRKSMLQHVRRNHKPNTAKPKQSSKLKKKLTSKECSSHKKNLTTTKDFLQNSNDNNSSDMSSMDVLVQDVSFSSQTIQTDDSQQFKSTKPGDDSDSQNPNIKLKSKEKQNKTFKCTVCGKTFTDKAEIVAHRRSENHFQPLPISPIECNDCGKLFASKSKMIIHQTSVHLKLRPYVCSYCNKGFGHRNTLINHLSIHTDAKPFVCTEPECGKQYRRKSNLRLHMATHKQVKEFVCSQCGKQFYHKYSMQHHEKNCSSLVHSRTENGLLLLNEEEICQNKRSPAKSTKSFICSICGKGLTSRFNLKAHEENHSVEKRYSCRFCHKGFASPYYLQQHENSHNKNDETKVKKKYACSLCEKTFTEKSRMRFHEQMHRGIKPYNCRFCDKSFTQKGHLKLHEQVHLGIKNFKCTFCDKEFRARGNLREHEMTQHSTGESKVSCNICHNIFPHKYALYRHTRKHREGKLDCLPMTLNEGPYLNAR